MKPMMRTETVCVMDAAGRVGEAMVEKLLCRGYTVHAASTSNAPLRKLLLQYSPSPDNSRLKLFPLDLFDFNSILVAMRGCSGLFYSFHPSSGDHHNYDEYMVEEEVRAAQNVLEACAQTETMSRVVFTSSVTAVVWKESRKSAAGPADLSERDWSEPNFCRKFKLWHGLAKALSEKTAWGLAMDRGVDMVSVNAGLVVGPGLTSSDPYLKGAPEMYGAGVLVTVNMDFLVDAHVAVYEAPAAFGRYICFDNAICRPEDAVDFAKMLSPCIASPPSSEELEVIPQGIECKKLNKLMVAYASGRHVEWE